MSPRRLIEGDASPEATHWVLLIHRAKSSANDHERSLADTIAAAADAGCSWTTIARGLGVSRQAAWRAWHDRVTARA